MAYFLHSVRTVHDVPLRLTIIEDEVFEEQHLGSVGSLATGPCWAPTLPKQERTRKEFGTWKETRAQVAILTSATVPQVAGNLTDICGFHALILQSRLAERHKQQIPTRKNPYSIPTNTSGRTGWAQFGW